MTTHDFDAVIVGSGFGGSVVAHRIAEAGMSVCVLERGQAYAPGDFPRTPREIRSSFWDPSEGYYGLYNVWSFPGLGALVSSGLGGGSLIYANVLLRKDADTFVRDEHESWPITYDDLEPHYERAERMLGGSRYPITEAPYARTGKTRAMEEAATALRALRGFEGVSWERPLLAVSFADGDDIPRPGVELSAAPPSVHDRPHPRLTCMLTGECDLGCNYGSKNTLDLTYLGLAKSNGAVIRTNCEVTRLAPQAGGYRISFVDHTELVADRAPRSDIPEQTMTARRLVLGAGAFGSTFLLLKSRAEFPRLSDRLGTQFSSNGDLLSFVLRTHDAGDRDPRVLDPSFGPVITSAIRVPKSARRRGHYVEDAGYPYLASWIAELATLPSVARRAVRDRAEQWLRRLVGAAVDTDLGAELAAIIGDGVLSSSSMPLLSMGRDIPHGRLFLDDGRLTTDWSAEGSDSYFDELEDTLRAISTALGGTFRDSRIRGLTKLITVHPLGGCPIGVDANEGVADPYGEVFGYSGFFIADGSAMPGPIGPNPSLTIAAFADRCAERILATV